MIPVSSLGDVSDTRKKILQNTLEDELKEHFMLISQERFEEAQEKAFEELDYEECTEDQCIMMIQEMLQVENVFHLEVIGEGTDTQLSLSWRTLDEKKKETDVCIGCGTFQLNDKVKSLFLRTIGIRSENKENEDKSVNVKNIKTTIPIKFKEYTDSFTGMKFVKVPNRNHWIGKYEVTQGEWEKVMGSNPSKHKNGNNFPVENLSWNDADRFVKEFNKKNLNKNYIFRLPNREERSNACKGGKNYLFGTSTGKLDRTLGNYGTDECCDGDDSDGFFYTAPVGSYPPNPYGLHDMSGNVREFINHKEGQKVFQDSSWHHFYRIMTCKIMGKSDTNPEHQLKDWNQGDKVGLRLLMELKN